MKRLEGRRALITGASSGIGQASARALAAEGASLVLVARREVRLRALGDELRESFGTDSHTVVLDVRDRSSVETVLGSLPSPWNEIDILLNNAGLSRGLAPVGSGDPDDWDEMIDTNVKGLLYVTRTLLPSMLEREHGHIINIGSIAGHEVYPNGAVYCATKWAVRALTQGIREDVHGTPVRVSTVDPGLVETEFSVVRFHGNRERAAQVYENTRPLTAVDVAEAVAFCATRPPHANVAELVLLASDQATATKVHRRNPENPSS